MSGELEVKALRQKVLGDLPVNCKRDQRNPVQIKSNLLEVGGHGFSHGNRERHPHAFLNASIHIRGGKYLKRSCNRQVCLANLSI